MPKARTNILLLALAGAAALGAQDPSAVTPQGQEPGSIDGVVRSNATGQPLRRAQVVLNPVGARGARFQTTGDDGKFSFPAVPPGRYSISVERDGFLRLTAGRLGSYKMPPEFSVRPGETVAGFDFPMIPAGVITGKVKFDDAEPATNVTVQVYRGYYRRGRHGYMSAATALTNDRGEYRLSGLAPGTYFIAALYRALARPANAEEQPRTDPAGNVIRELSYATTFFPQTQKMAEAVAVGVQSGEEIGGIDIFLARVHTVRIRGRVISALSGQPVQAPGISLRWNDPDNTGSVTAPVDISFDKDQNFEMKGVPSGLYWLLVAATEDGHPLAARIALNVGEEDIGGVNIAIGPEAVWKGKLQFDADNDSDNPPALKGLALSFEPRRATASPVSTEVSDKGDFTATLWPDETYDVYLANAPQDLYLKSVRVANTEHLASGLEAQPGDTPPAIEAVLSSTGGQVIGRAVTTDSMVVASGAALALIPDPPDGRVQTYKSGFADEYGVFRFQGVAPGRYVLVGWMDQPPCDPYDPEDLPACRAHGTALAIAEGAAQTLELTVN